MRDILILDYEGKLSNSLLNNLGVNYVDKYSSKIRFDLPYNRSLVRENFLNNYFQRDKFTPIIIK